MWRLSTSDGIKLQKSWWKNLKIGDDFLEVATKIAHVDTQLEPITWTGFQQKNGKTRVKYT